jgi:hypothetical protein
MSDVKRYHPHHPDLHGLDVVRARDYDVLDAKLNYVEALADDWVSMHARVEAERNILRDDLMELREDVAQELRLQILYMRRQHDQKDTRPSKARRHMAMRLAALLHRCTAEPNCESEKVSSETTPA